MTTPCEIEKEFQKTWLPFYCGGQDLSDVDEFAFLKLKKEWLPRLNILNVPAIDAQMLCDVVHKKVICKVYS